MTQKDISTIYRFLGVIEGVAVSLPDDVQSMIYDYLEVVNCILDNEVKDQTEKGGVQK